VSGSCLLLPVAGVVDGFGLNVKFTAQPSYQCLRRFYMQVRWASSFLVGYYTDENSLSPIAGSWLVAQPVKIHGLLSLPFLCWLYLAVAGAEPVTNNIMTVDIFGITQTAQKGQLLNIARHRTAIVNLDTAPEAHRLRCTGQYSFFDWYGPRIAGKTKCPGRRWIITQ
jgi:hypothetical protein